MENALEWKRDTKGRASPMRTWRSELVKHVDDKFALAIKADDELASLGARRTRAIRAFHKAIPDLLPKPRKRRITISRAMKQAAEAGLIVKGVVVKPDGAVELQLNEAGSDQPNPWDSI
jgi:hypothetical protein